MIRRQEIYFINNNSTSIPLGQLCLVQDVIHNVINKLSASLLSSPTDFALFLCQKNGSINSESISFYEHVNFVVITTDC